MATTALSVTATPGKPHSFSPKTPAGEHGGLFTELSVTATPGRRHSFLAKTPADAVVHTGLFTELSVTATPGRRHTFAVKTAAPTIEIPVGPSGDRYTHYKNLVSVHKDDEEILQTIIAFVLSE